MHVREQKAHPPWNKAFCRGGLQDVWVYRCLHLNRGLYIAAEQAHDISVAGTTLAGRLLTARDCMNVRGA